ncbi:hypothetical protein PAECIP111893_02397 [Paenibacillus plantiphilus]|uniref:Uncharacterized protein n=1 Tax=Paenibacillus plantiphilus TaxID=2905650 RepID=A0ABM9C6X2_9BACL|nr:hypothetical protein [Paenibacillus plantiphilus]CAH1205703.1 hypothetical protein PAECIP111893_02397 [Paenibacillus plantiphilus]
MNWKDCYSDICAEIRIMGIHEMELRKRVELAHKAMFTGELPSSGSYCHLPLDKGIEQYNAAVTELDAIQAEVDRLNGVKSQMEQQMSQFTGLAHVIEYKRLVEGKTYGELSSELGYSENYLRQFMHRKRNKMITQSTNVS